MDTRMRTSESAQKKEDDIQTYLLSKGIDPFAVRGGTMQKLSKVYDVVHRRMDVISDLQQQIRDNDINIQSVAEESGISRRTFYNVELLKQYVEDSAAKMMPKDTPSTKKDQKTADYIDELERELQALNMKVLINEITKHRLQRLEKELEQYKQYTERLQTHCQQQKEIIQAYETGQQQQNTNTR